MLTLLKAKVQFVCGVMLAVLALVCSGLLIRHQKANRATIDQAKAQALSAAEEKETFRVQADNLKADLATVTAKAADQAQQIARLKAAKPNVLEAPKNAPDPAPELRQLAVAQDGLIQTQTQALDIHARREAALEGQATATNQQVQALQVQIAAIEPERPWSLGPLVGVSLKGEPRLGAIGSGSYKRVTGHVLILGDYVAAGVSWRFGGGQ